MTEVAEPPCLSKERFEKFCDAIARGGRLKKKLDVRWDQEEDTKGRGRKLTTQLVDMTARARVSIQDLLAGMGHLPNMVTWTWICGRLRLRGGGEAFWRLFPSHPDALRAVFHAGAGQGGGERRGED